MFGNDNIHQYGSEGDKDRLQEEKYLAQESKFKELIESLTRDKTALEKRLDRMLLTIIILGLTTLYFVVKHYKFSKVSFGDIMERFD